MNIRQTVLLLMVLFAVSPVMGQEGDRQYSPHGVSYDNLTVLRYNPQGLQDDFKVHYRYQLYGEEPSLLFRDCEILAGSTVYLTPAFVRTGARVGVRPLAILYLEARMDWMASFGLLGHVVGFPSPLSDASDGTVKERSEDEAIQTTGWIATLTAELRGKVGPVVLRSKGAMIHANMDLNAGDSVWYEGVNDVLMPSDGWMLHLDNDLLWMDGGPWVFGIRHTMDHVFYPDTDGLDGDALDEKNQTHRLGILAAYRFFDEPGAAFNRPTLAMIVNWHLKHPYRTGQEVHQGIPYTLLAFAFLGDLLGAVDCGPDLPYADSFLGAVGCGEGRIHYSR